MKISKETKRALLLGILILFLSLIGQRVAHGYLHPADPIVMLAAMLLPLPHAMIAAGVAGVAVDLIKGLYLLSPATLIAKLLMVLAVHFLLKTKPAQKHPELITAPAALIPAPIYYLAELINQLILGKGLAAFSAAAITLQSDLVQAAAGILIYIFLYDLYKGIKAGREEMRRIKAQEAAAKEETPDENA